ncbi:MAG: DMT family transporter [Desulfuromonadales bacterium]|nr:DMT family transporter [Desulfuromonadales bacterium]NIR34002.1 DMT family transporter [Desulfuromonadales bacterium]NIS42674.1 DMT family transporter [Desulfuromonadales bacterium]
MAYSLFLVFIALIAGFIVPTQAGINAQLSLWTRSPVLAATVSFAVGTVALLIYAIVMRIPLPNWSSASSHPWWIWSGGVLGAFFVTATIMLAPKLGAALMVVLILAGQLIASLVLDHFGWLGFPVQQISAGRILGVALVAAGVLLVRFY